MGGGRWRYILGRWGKRTFFMGEWRWVEVYFWVGEGEWMYIWDGGGEGGVSGGEWG